MSLINNSWWILINNYIVFNLQLKSLYILHNILFHIFMISWKFYMTYNTFYYLFIQTVFLLSLLLLVWKQMQNK